MNIIDEYEQKPINELFDNAEYAINQLCEKGFRGFTMSIPVQVTDTDIVLSVAIKMARQRIAELERQNELLRALGTLVLGFVGAEDENDALTLYAGLLSFSKNSELQAAINGGALSENIE